MKTKIFSCIILIAAFLNSYGQSNYITEKIIGNKFELIFKNEIPFNLEKKENKNIIKFQGFMDESKPGEFILPAKDIFINIPANTTPSVKLIPIKTTSINALPAINPNVLRINDSTKIYTEVSEPVLRRDENLFSVKGFLWIGNQYCIHLSVKPFYYNFNKRASIKLDEYQIQLSFDKNLDVSENSEIKRDELIANKKYLFPADKKDYIGDVITSDDWIDFSKTYLKIGTSEDAIYRISKQNLLSANVPANSINPKTFKMYWKGNEIPILVSGEQDNQFDDNDFIEFVGRKNYGDENYREPAEYNEPYTEYINKYSDTTIYWLTWDGADGKRTQTELVVNGSTTDTLEYYDELIHVETNHWYDFALGGSSVRREYPFIYENETWNWWGQNVGTRNFGFTASELYPNKPANAYVKLQSWSTNQSTNAHLLHLKINSNPSAYDSGYIDKYEVKTLHAAFSSDILSNGSNTLKTISEATLSNPNRCFGDWWEIEYPRYLKVMNDSLLFAYRNLTAPVFSNVKLTNIQSPNITLYKFYDDYNNIKVTNFNRTSDVITFADTVHQGQKYIITENAKIKSPVIYSTKQFVNLSNPSNQADYILITHPMFISVAETYISFIESNYGVTTKLINVYDIYDEFNYGFFAPEPIKDFLMTASSNWQQPAPKNVFIVGRANYDFHGYKTTYFNSPVEPNYVPSYGVPVSDNWFVIWDSTGAAIPQMNIGRLPARSVEEFQHFFSKHQNYISKNITDWNKKYLMLTGGNFTNPSQIARLKQVNDFIADNHVSPAPIGGIATHFYKTANPVTNFGPYPPEFVQKTFEEGSVFISYLGHSGTQTWDNSITDPTQLDNLVDRNPLISDFGCSTAKFAEPDITSFSELFVNGLNGQAIAYVGNTSLGYESTATTYPRYFYGKILRDSVYSLGDAHRLSKIDMLNEISSSGTYEVFSYTNTLVGDPIINLPIPAKPNLTISSDGITFTPSIPIDNKDSLQVTISYKNLGRVISDSLIIKVEDVYNQLSNYSQIIKRQLPLNYDQISLSIPIKDLPGEHTLRVILDETNVIDEFDETDNLIELNYNVLTATIRTTNIYESANLINNKIVFLNPSADPGVNNFNLELSFNKEFENSVVQSIAMDTFFTGYNLTGDYLNNKFWARTKLPNSSQLGITQEFLHDNDNGFFADDSGEFIGHEGENVSFRNSVFAIDTSEIKFEVLSAGYNDGRTALISLNGPNLIPENTLRGHHIIVFKDVTFEFVEYKRFDVFSGGAQITNYIDYLDGLDESHLLFTAVTDEGRVTSDDLKNKLKEFGSVYIDSLVVRGSWAFIGKRNAAPGSMPEAVSAPFEGRVSIDTTIFKPQTFGKLVTQNIGPASEWENLKIDTELFGDSQIKVRPIGITELGEKDTLEYLSLINDQSSLTGLSGELYPTLKLIVELEASSSGNSPFFKSVKVTHKKLPELGTNFQVVNLSQDSVTQGEDISLSFYVYNIGDVKADSVNVEIELIDSELVREKVFEQQLASLNPFERKQVNFTFNTVNTNGSKQFLITIDPEDKVSEIFEDNNFFTVPFSINTDSTKPDVQISFDGKEIIDGEYISSNPLIRIELGDPSLIPIVDTSSVVIQLNNKEIYYSNPENNLNYTFSNENPKMVVEYQPVLEKGEYLFNVFAKDASGNLVNPAGVTKTFYVDDETKLIDMFNYPNPFKDDTYFTFKLTQLPDELKINVYTVAGRLVKEIDIMQSELNFDFNKIYWDGKDEDGDRLANGVYFYKVIMKAGDEINESIHKMAILK
ncbi:MAG: hypothetical protein HND52_15915 [Ignavibacteriae bacterium]|nr:hypothetical protein [Ignavibacteriota bacterium]NOG99442.1 hypothetical protein [Ignavibacteriota bacterium]